MLRFRIGAVLADAPVLFLAVVIGVALTFKVAVGWARTEVAPEPSVAAAPAPKASATVALSADPAAKPQLGSAATAGTQVAPPSPPPAKRKKPRPTR